MSLYTDPGITLIPDVGYCNDQDMYNLFCSGKPQTSHKKKLAVTLKEENK